MELSNHFGHTVFCDDIRQEIGGKLSFIGVYSTFMYVHGVVPFAISKFGFGITYFQRHDVFEGNVMLKIYCPGDDNEAPTVAVELPMAELNAMPRNPPEFDSWPVGEFIRVDHQIVASPLVLLQTGTIKVRAVTASGDVAKIGILRIGQRLPQPTDPPG